LVRSGRRRRRPARPAESSGLDLDEASVELARANVFRAGLADRVTVTVRDAADPALAGRYDLATIFEALHDMSQPVPAAKH